MCKNRHHWLDTLQNVRCSFRELQWVVVGGWGYLTDSTKSSYARVRERENEMSRRTVWAWMRSIKLRGYIVVLGWHTLFRSTWDPFKSVYTLTQSAAASIFIVLLYMCSLSIIHYKTNTKYTYIVFFIIYAVCAVRCHCFAV